VTDGAGASSIATVAVEIAGAPAIPPDHARLGRDEKPIGNPKIEISRGTTSPPWPMTCWRTWRATRG
jgi:hypothetical protein